MYPILDPHLEKQLGHGDQICITSERNMNIAVNSSLVVQNHWMESEHFGRFKISGLNGCWFLKKKKKLYTPRKNTLNICIKQY